jgi:hypothetical protein
MLDKHQPGLLGKVHTESLYGHFDRQFERWEALFQDKKIPASTTTAKIVANVMAPIEWYKQRIFAGAQMGDNYARTVAFYHSVAKQMDAIPAYRMPLRNALNLQARHLQVEQALMLDGMDHTPLIHDPHNFDFPDVLPVHKDKVFQLSAEIQRVAEDPNALQALTALQDERNTLIAGAVKNMPPAMQQTVAKKLFGQIAAEETYAWFGKYDNLTAEQWAGMRKLVPFWLWWMHAMSIAKALPTRAPLRSALLGRLLAHAPLALQPQGMADVYKKMGAIPVTTRQRGTGKEVPLYDAAGFPQLDTGSAWVPITQVPEFAAEIDKVTKGNSDNVSMPFLNVAVQTSSWLTLTMLDNHYRDPSMYDTKGKRFDAQGNLVKNTPLPIINVTGRILLPGFEKNAREYLAFPYKPSDQTTILNKAPQQYNGRFVPQGGNPLSLMTKQFMKADTMPEVVTQSQEAMQRAYNMRDFLMSRGRHPKAQE